MPSTSPLVPLSESDQELFRRVWQRVMPQPDAASPIVLSPPPESAPPDTSREELPAPSPAPEDAAFSALVQEMAAREQAFARRYQALSRRLRGEASRSARILAGQAQQNARRLSAVYFLITGIRSLVPSPASRLSPGEDPAALIRRSFAEAQAAEASYRAASDSCPSPFLAALFHTLSQSHAAHQQQLITLLTQL